MTVDREQIRRDALHIIDRDSLLPPDKPIMEYEHTSNCPGCVIDALIDALDDHPTVDACIIAALETKLAEAEQLYKKRYDWAMHERDIAQERAEKAEQELERCETRLYLQRQRAELAERALAIETERT